jgi:hypothetical protein
MRRALSILLVLFFGLGPLAATLDASDDVRLPICCRRNGSHHCSISGDALARILQASSGSTPVLAAPGHCPLYPGTAPATISPIHAQTTPSSASFAVQGHGLSAQSPQLAARSSEANTHAVRGPPNSIPG